MGLGIKIVKPSAGDPKAVGRGKVDLAAIRREDEKLNARWAPHLRANGEGLQCFVDKAAVDHAVRTEGPGVMTPAGAGYWEDMKRRYPHLRGAMGRVDGDSVNGRRCRFGVVKERYQGGRWWKPVAGGWKPA